MRMTWINQYKRTILPYQAYLNEICAPLFNSTPISYFGYIKTCLDGSMLHFCSNSSWLEHYLDKKYFQISNFKNLPQNYAENYILCDYLQAPAANIAKEASDAFAIRHVITLLEKNDHGCEFFQFGTSTADNSITSFYLNNLDLLKLFIFFFKDKANNLIKNAITENIVIPAITKPPATAINKHINKVKKDLLNNINRFHFKTDDNYLTPQEVNCIYWLAHGKSAEEIAAILKLSKRTIETHLENVKRKLNCYKQCQIIYKATQMGILV